MMIEKAKLHHVHPKSIYICDTRTPSDSILYQLSHISHKINTYEMEFLNSKTPNTNCYCLQANCPHIMTGVAIEPKRLSQFMVIHNSISKACLQKMKEKKEKKKKTFTKSDVPDLNPHQLFHFNKFTRSYWFSSQHTKRDA